MLADGTNTYLYGPSAAPGSAQDDRLAQYQTAMQYFGADGLGSVRQIYDASGQVVGSTRYDPYGNVMSQSGTATSVFAFAGEQYDAGTGLEYLRARYYSSAQGRFTTRDMWEGDPNSPMSYNAWLYAYANSVNLTDPSGHDPYWCDTALDPQGCRAAYYYGFWKSSHPNDPITAFIDPKCLQSTWVLSLLRQSPVCRGKVGQDLVDCEQTSQNQYNGMIIEAVDKYFGLSEIFYVSKIVKRMIPREGVFDPAHGAGTTGGIGLMGITLAAKTDVEGKYSRDFPGGVINRLDPQQNIRAGVAFLRILQDSLIRQDIDHRWSTPRAQLWRFTVASYRPPGLQAIRVLRADAEKDQKDPTLWSSIDDKVGDGAKRYVDDVFSDFAKNPF